MWCKGPGDLGGARRVEPGDPLWPSRVTAWQETAAEARTTKADQDVGGEEVTAETRTFEPNQGAKERLVTFLEKHIPRFLGPEPYTKTCLYTMPPDRHFIIDAAPDHPRFTVAVDGGHAFKFATLIGRILSQLALDGQTEYPIAHFRADRPALTDPTFQPVFRNEAVLSRS